MAREPFSQRPGFPPAQCHQGAGQRHAAHSACREPGLLPTPTERRPHPGRPRASLGPGEGGLPGGPEPESPLSSPHLSFPRRSTTSTKWQSAAPRAGSATPRPAGRTGRLAPHRAERAGPQPVHWGPGPPACTALPPPAPVPSPSMRAAASLPVKVSPGPSCRTPRRPGEAEKGGGMRERDLTPSLREDGHLAPARAQSLVLPPSVEVPIGDQEEGGS